MDFRQQHHGVGGVLVESHAGMAHAVTAGKDQFGDVIAAFLVAPQRAYRVGNAVVVASYHGFSGNPGRPSQTRMMADAAAFIAFAREKAGPNARVWLIGHSIGAAVVLNAAAVDQSIEGVIAMNAFSRVAAAAPRITRALIPDRWDNLTALKSLKHPVIFMQGGRDRIVPASSGDELFSAYGGPSSLIIGETAYHNPDMATLGPWLNAAIAAMQTGSLATLPSPPPGWVEKVRRP